MPEARIHGHFQSYGPIYEPGQVVKDCNPSSWEAEFGCCVHGQPELQTKFDAGLGKPVGLNHQVVLRCSTQQKKYVYYSWGVLRLPAWPARWLSMQGCLPLRLMV